MSSRIPSARRAAACGRRAIRKSLRPIPACWRWRTTATRCSCTPALSWRRRDGNMRARPCASRNSFAAIGGPCSRRADSGSKAGLQRRGARAAETRGKKVFEISHQRIRQNAQGKAGTHLINPVPCNPAERDIRRFHRFRRFQIPRFALRYL